MARVPTAADGLPAAGAASAPAAEPWRAIDWRSHQRWVRVDGRWANVISLGEGPPLLFVHGLSGCWQNWLEQLPAFAAAGYQAIAVDLPGFGVSQLPEREISIPAYAAFLDRLLDALEVSGPATVVGNSMGGFVAAELALAVPQRVQRLVLVAAAGISSDRAKRAPMVTGARALGIVTAWAASRHEPFARRPRLRRLALRFVVRHPDRLSAPLAYELMEGSGRPGFVPALDALLRYPLRDRLGQIVCPTLIVWGDRDQIVPVGDAHRFERLIPGARKVILPDTGHVTMLERPLIFNGLLRGFLAE
ncbi:alpha/beta hydrolase [Conexibacter sp. JD483]|uniref:alpha/beta fold hydrolase n=1 Tax=unclassified Conexibacter TaxID=2627773 RepID=UPI0027202BFD|nr:MULTISPECIES: alpha/beta hydrolase [unclassified Conexibacter]MDO8184513.1 alpha/beta hydrolase [Conexibacter sp. CPCC 205706]MDO8197819.1 alpha/beta hydrolase [Conexibacter sp. CPCC 205762]MDR9369225.1 alpha/beta hydrolase [Conexibacter sp. JD483]